MFPKLPDVVLNRDEARLTHEPFGEVRIYFEGKTDLLTSVTAGSLILLPGASPHPPHQHPDEEFLLITDGTGEITIGDQVTQVGPGSQLYVSGDKLHGVENTGGTPMTFYFYKWLA